ncbi:MAG: TIGR01621 family pseudouridine synthase [Thalassotalea sp.]
MTPLFTLIDQQADFIVVNKAADCNFHDEGDINNGLFNHVKQTLKLDELFPVHRLDKMTSGIIIFAKNKPAAAKFQTLFSEHQIEKYYLAISDQKPKKKQGLIKGDMAKSRRGAWKLLRTMVNPAITQFFSYNIGAGLRLYLLKPHSGKTHQIRVALASIGAQILGDATYSQSGADRGYLHALALKFELNGIGYQYHVLPDSGQHFMGPIFTELKYNELKQNELKSATEGTDQELTSALTKPWQLAWPSVK